MKIIRLVAFISADGCWLHPGPATIPYMKHFRILEHYRNSDFLLTSDLDYAEIFQRNGYWPFKYTHTYVIASSCTNVTPEAPVTFIPVNQVDAIRRIKQKGEGLISVLLSGISSDIVSFLLSNDLMDEMRLITLPLTQKKGLCLLDKCLTDEWSINRKPLRLMGITEMHCAFRKKRMHNAHRD